MLDVIQQRKTGVKILMGVILGMICLAMVITLVPGLVPGAMTGMNSPDAVARVGDEQITRTDVENMLNRELRGQSFAADVEGHVCEAGGGSAGVSEGAGAGGEAAGIASDS